MTKYLIQIGGLWRVAHLVLPSKYGMTGASCWSDVHNTAYLGRFGEETAKTKLPQEKQIGALETGFSRPSIHNVTDVQAHLIGHCVSLKFEQPRVGPTATLHVFFETVEQATWFAEAIDTMRRPADEYPGEVTDPAGTSGPGRAAGPNADPDFIPQFLPKRDVGGAGMRSEVEKLRAQADNTTETGS